MTTALARIEQALHDAKQHIPNILSRRLDDALAALAELRKQPGLEPRGCPTPGACSCPAAVSATGTPQKTLELQSALIGFRGRFQRQGFSMDAAIIQEAIDALAAPQPVASAPEEKDTDDEWAQHLREAGEQLQKALKGDVAAVGWIAQAAADYHANQASMADSIGEESLSGCVKYHDDRERELLAIANPPNVPPMNIGTVK